MKEKFLYFFFYIKEVSVKIETNLVNNNLYLTLFNSEKKFKAQEYLLNNNVVENKIEERNYNLISLVKTNENIKEYITYKVNENLQPLPQFQRRITGIMYSAAITAIMETIVNKVKSLKVSDFASASNPTAALEAEKLRLEKLKENLSAKVEKLLK